MIKTSIPKILTIGILLPAVLLLSGCNPLERDSQSSSFIIVESITGTDIEGNEVNFLQSDVAHQSSGTNVVTADVASATMRAAMYNPDPILDPNQYNDIILDRYVVSYSRTDGKNTPGVDVPYSFEASLTQTLQVGSSQAVSIVVVREVSKLEPPLINLVQNRDAGVIEMKATIDFYGHDLTNNKVSATGSLTIFFANYADQESSPATNR